MGLICRITVLYMLLLGAIFMEEETRSSIRRKKTCPIESFQTVMKIHTGDATTYFCPTKIKPVKVKMDLSQLPPWLCFKDECMTCGKTEPPSRCFVRGVLYGLITESKKWICIVAIVCILCIGYLMSPDMYGRLL